MRKIVTSMVIVVCAICIGCGTHFEGKEVVRQHWEKSSAQIKFNVAQQQYNDKRLDEAISTVSESVTADPCFPDARLMYGQLLFLKGRHKEAEEQLNEAVRLDENLKDGWYWLGMAAQQKGDYDKARDCYGKASELDPVNVDYALAVSETCIMQAEYDHAVRFLEDKIEAMPGEISLKVAAADLLTRMGRDEQAIALYKQAMLVHGDDDAIAESLGYCYVFSGKWRQGADIFTKLAANCLDEDRSKLYLKLVALCSMNSSQYRQAVHYYDRLSVAEIDNAEVWLKMGQAALGAGAAERARACGEKVLSLRPDSTDAVVLIGCAEYVLRNYGPALRCFERIADDDKNASLSTLMRARCYEKLEQTGKGGSAYEQALAKNPDGRGLNLTANEKEARLSTMADSVFLWE